MQSFSRQFVQPVARPTQRPSSGDVMSGGSDVPRQVGGGVVCGSSVVRAAAENVSHGDDTTGWVFTSVSYTQQRTFDVACPAL